MFSPISIKSHAISVACVFFMAVSLISRAQSTPEPQAVKAGAPAELPANIQTSVQTLIDNHRRILSLQSYSIDPANTAQQHQEAVRSGEFLFIQDQHLISGIIDRLITQHPGQSDIDDFLNVLNSPQLKDADLFAMRPILTEVAKKVLLAPAEGKKLRILLKNLAATHNKYGQELVVALSQTKISKVTRPAWAQYIAEIEQQYPAEALMQDLKSAIPTPEQQVTPSTKTEDVVTLARQNEWLGTQLEKGSVLLTFDDGPHPVYTKEILAILERYRVKAIFFQLGQNLGTVTDGHAELTRNEDVEKEILSAGHAIGNHSFSHPFLPKLDEAHVGQEIDKTQALLNLIIPEDAHRTHMFRAPYGARNSMILGEVGERGLRSVLWNVDSLDWSDPIPESIVHRILQELDHAGRGIILMHDIHPKTVIALPILLDELIKRGYHFVQWDGIGSLVPTNRNSAEIESDHAILPASVPVN